MAPSRKSRFLWLIATPSFVVLVLGFIVAYQFVGPAPPKRIVMLTGPEGGAYHDYGEAYRKSLFENGIELVLVPSSGSNENLDALLEQRDGAQLAFVQGGVALDRPGAARGELPLVSLGSVYFEPLWIFRRAGMGLASLAELQGKRINVGAREGGTFAAVEKVLTRFGIDAENSTWSHDPPATATTRLLAGELDAIAIVSSADSQWVKQLLESPEVVPYHFARGRALSELLPFLSPVTLFAGVVDLKRGIPPEDVSLVAPAATIVAHDDLHPAITDLVLQAAERAHRRGGWFEEIGQFPSRDFLDLPLSKEADRFFKHGPPFLQRFLPFWIATLVDRLKVMLIPLLTLLIPLMKVFPPLLRWRVRRKIIFWYKELGELEKNTTSTDDRVGRLSAMLEEIDRVEVPLSYADQLYNLKVHVVHVSERLGRAVRGDG